MRSWLWLGGVLVLTAATPVSAQQQPAPVSVTEIVEPTGPVIWAEVDYLLRWVKPVCLKPPVLTVGGTGVIGQPGTRVVMGGNDEGPHKFEFRGASGARATIGAWLTPESTLEVSGFLLERTENRQEFFSDANGSPASFIPFQDAQNAHMVLPFTEPGVTSGSAVAVGSTKLWGVESNWMGQFTAERDGTFLAAGFSAGIRYLDLHDRVEVTNFLRSVTDPDSFNLGRDTFTTRNQFAGGQLGCRLGIARGNFSLEYITKLAAGLTHQVRDVAGNPQLASGGLAPPVTGPLLALASNIGRDTANRVTLVPEIAVRARWQVAPGWALTLGYSLLYWNKVLCPGDQMDPHANITQLPGMGPVVGPLLPPKLFNHTDYFAQGLDAGIEWRY